MPTLAAGRDRVPAKSLSLAKGEHAISSIISTATDSLTNASRTSVPVWTGWRGRSGLSSEGGAELLVGRRQKATERNLTVSSPFGRWS